MARGKRNDVQRLREEQLMSKAELARREIGRAHV